MRIHLVVNVSQIVRYREPVVGQRVIILKLAEADREKKWKVEKILNKQKSKRSNQVLSTVEGVHSRTWHMRKKGGLRKYKRDNSRLWRKNKYRSQKTVKNRNSRRTRL